MRMLKIALGCDGILADFAAGILQLVESVTGKKFSSSAITGPDFARALDLTTGEARGVRAALGQRGFALSLRPYPGARQGVRRLRKLGEVLCVSTPWEGSPTAWWIAERNSWLALHFGIDRVHHVVEADEGAARVQAWCEADMFVEEGAARVQGWMGTWPGRAAVLWRTPHNAREPVPPGAYSTNSWEELYEIAVGCARTPSPAPGGAL